MINFVIDPSANYAGVQQMLLTSIARHLPRGSFTESVGQRRSGVVNFSLFVRQPADFVMSHGVADKNYFTDVRDPDGKLFASRLSGVFVPGEWLKRKLVSSAELGLRADQIHVVGWPRLDDLRHQLPRQRVPGRMRVLWAPTHDYVKRGPEQQSTSTFPLFARHLEPLKQHADVLVSLHPRNRPSKNPTVGGLVHADCVVSDFGTMVYEAWALGKPVIFPRWILGDRIQQYLPGSAEAFIFERRIGYHPESFDELVAILQNGPKVSPEVHAFMADYVANARSGTSSDRIAALLINATQRAA